MAFIFTLLSWRPFLNPLSSVAGIAVAVAGWFALLAVAIYFARRWRGFNRPLTPRLWAIWAGLAVLTLFTSLFIGVRLPFDPALFQPSVPVDPQAPAWMIFAALPWMLAAGFAGVRAAASLAGISGLLLALWETHNPFTPLIYVLLAILFAAAIHQRYRTRVFAWLRSPFLTSLLMALVYPMLNLLGTALATDGGVTARLDLALTQLIPFSLVAAGQLVIGGLFSEAFRLGFARDWGSTHELRPSPPEKSMQLRFLYQIAPVAFVLTVLLMLTTVVVSERAARNLLEERMADAARSAAQGIPFFLETGQDWIQKLASDPNLLVLTPAQIGEYLRQENRQIPFFSQLFLIDAPGAVRRGMSMEEYSATLPPSEEQLGVQRALDGVLPFQYNSISAAAGGKAARVSFVAVIKDGNQQIRGALVGRADLAENPLMMPVINSLMSLDDIDGEGILIDDSGLILFHPNSDLLMSEYSGRIPDSAENYDEPASDGTRQIVFFHPAVGRPWAVILNIPARYAQKLALDIAAPLLGMILLLVLFAAITLRLSMRRLTVSLRDLAHQASNLAEGHLDNALPVRGEDEVGQLSRAFEQMRVSLKTRLEELNRLLAVSQGVASSLEVSESIHPVLEAAVGMGVSVSRVILNASVLPEVDDDTRPVAFGLGSSSDEFAYLDEQILEMVNRQDRIILNNIARARVLRFPRGARRPEAFLALPLRHENTNYGAFWVGFDQPHRFSEEEVRFFTTLAGQAVLAAVNARLFMSAELGRQRLAAVLASTPDPVLVTDRQNRLMLVNPAAWRVFGISTEWQEKQPVSHLLRNKELLDLLNTSLSEQRFTEVELEDGKTYYVTVSPVMTEGQTVGRVCILRDITYFKTLDALKSEFVATVSHDLRSPLTLVRGYATMLDMVGELNEQQTNYVRRIIGGVESMTRLVGNLLDLGRIEAGIGLQLEMVPVSDTIERVISGLQLQATQKKIHLSSNIPPQTIPLIEADQALLQQALHNLVENGIKYTEPNGQVKVRVNVRADNMVFEVQDTGIGIAPVDQPHLFDKFYRGAQHSGKKAAGTGLGLAIVKSIVERHGGKVWVESQLGKGSTFYFDIPLRQPKPPSLPLDQSGAELV